MMATPGLADPISAEEITWLPAYTLVESRVANPAPAATLATPVSSLRYEPQVDLQSRNSGEAQGDVTLRGGIFENTGFQVGALPLFDPQTGHYFAEIPIPPAMLSGPRVLTGMENAFSGFNSTVGTIHFLWLPIETRRHLSLAVGQGNLFRQEIMAGHWSGTEEVTGWGLQFAAGRSKADGRIANGDHRLHRLAGRWQWRQEKSETKIFAGYQSKFFGWPNLYTPFGVPETENLQTALYLVEHEWRPGPDWHWTIAGMYRRHKDDYEFDRTRPGLFNPYEHLSRVAGLVLGGEYRTESRSLRFRQQFLRDSLETTSLQFGPFLDRNYSKSSLLWEERLTDFGLASWQVQAGLTLDKSNRDKGLWAPMAGLRHVSGGGNKPLRTWYAEVVRTSQLPGYTALGSSATSGLFRGNPDLGRERSWNWETGMEWSDRSWQARTAVFQRTDDPLVDWTFSPGQVARTANEVAVTTTGVELMLWWSRGPWEALLGYTWLEKDARYADPEVGGSYYALNFARHRWTTSLRYLPSPAWELRLDNVHRIQAANPLRTEGGARPWHTTLGLVHRPHRWAGLSLEVTIANLWNSRYQDIPSVPAAPRQATAGMTYHW